MNFDRLGEQNVLKRRRPSPIRKTRRALVYTETGFSQDVWPRRREAAPGSGRLERIRRFIFDRVAPGNMEKPGKRHKGRPKGETFERSPRAEAGPAPNTETAQTTRRFGLSLPALVPFTKAAAATLAVLAIGIVGLNWDGVSGASSARPDISPYSLLDPVSPLQGLWTQEAPAVQATHWEMPPPAADGSVPVYAYIPLNVTKTFSWAPYVVAPGDTISGIAVRHGVSQESIIALNDIREAWNLQIGRTLKIPNMNGIPYTVMANDTLGEIARATGIPLNVLLDANDIYDGNIVPGQVLFIPGGRMDAGELRRAIWRAPERPLIRPVRGRITSGFGWREDPFNPGSGRMELHSAVDMAGRTGDPVRAAMRGTVLHRGANPTYGNFIVLQHGDYQTLYAHLSAFSVAVGDTVRQGQEIGRVGATGRATGPHLHFAVFRRGEPVNPVDLWR